MLPDRASPAVLLCACLGVALSAACATAQSEPPREPAAVRAGSVDVDDGAEAETEAGSPPAVRNAPADDAARAALERAARFQRGDTPRAAPRALHGRFYVGMRGEDGSMIKAFVERWFTARPERMLTTRTEDVTRSTSSVGYDGRTAWFRDHASGDTVVYTDDPGTFDEDLAQLHEQLRLTRLLLDAIVLDALLPRLVEPRVVGTGTIEDLDGVEHELELVAARLEDVVFGLPPGAAPPAPDDPPPMLDLRLGVDTESGALRSLQVAVPHRPDVAALDLRFDLFGRGGGGLTVPGNIRVYRAGETRERMTLGVDIAEDDAGNERLVLDVDPELDAALFAVPR